jgi:hypothetical protein
MTTAMLVLVAALALVISPTRLFSTLLIISLLYFNLIPTAITLAVLGLAYTLIRKI